MKKYSQRKNIKPKKHQDEEVELTPEVLQRIQRMLEIEKAYTDINGIFENIYDTTSTTQFKDMPLKSIYQFIDSFNYKLNDISQLNDAFTEIYKRDKAKFGHYMIDKIVVTDKNIDSSLTNAFGSVSPPFKHNKVQKFKLTISSGKRNKNKYDPKNNIAIIEDENVGFSYILTAIHELTHEKQMANVSRIFAGEKVSSYDALTTMYLLGSYIGSHKADYYNKFIEFEANYVSCIKTKELMDKGYLKSDKLRKLLLYKNVINAITYFKENRIINLQNAHMKQCYIDLMLSKNNNIISTYKNLTYAEINEYNAKIKSMKVDLLRLKYELQKDLVENMTEEEISLMNKNNDYERRNYLHGENHCKYLDKIKNFKAINYSTEYIYYIEYAKALKTLEEIKCANNKGKRHVSKYAAKNVADDLNM